MRKHKEHPRYHIVSIRISDEEKIALEEIMRRSSRSISSLLREAFHAYLPHGHGEIRSEQIISMRG